MLVTEVRSGAWKFLRMVEILADCGAADAMGMTAWALATEQYPELRDYWDQWDHEWPGIDPLTLQRGGTDAD